MSRPNRMRDLGRVAQFYQNHRELGKKYTVKHFLEEGIPKSTVYSVLKRVDDGETLERQPGSGRKAKKMTQSKISNVKRDLEDKVGSSVRVLARKYKISKSYLHRVVANKCGLTYYRRKRASLQTEAQKTKIKSRCMRLYRGPLASSARAEIVMDDESYFGFSGSEYARNRGFYSSDKSNCPPDVQYARKQKFPPRIMVWLAISPRGLSTPFIMEKGCMDGQTYLENCLRGRLVPFLDEKHPDRNILFWPDLASCHYHKDVTAFLEASGIPFVKKEDNPPNMPTIRPIETVWALLKQKVYEGNWTALSKQQLAGRIRRKIKEVDIEVVRTLLERVPGHLRLVGREGADALI